MSLDTRDDDASASSVNVGRTLFQHGDPEDITAMVHDGRIVYVENEHARELLRDIERGMSVDVWRDPLDEEELRNLVEHQIPDLLADISARRRTAADLPIMLRRWSRPAPPIDPPKLALRLFASGDAEQYAREWRAHLSELVAAGDNRDARRHRRRLAMRAPWFAVELRVRALLRQRARSWR